MNALGKKQLPIYFPYYLEQYERLQREYDQLPSWRWLKQHRNIVQRGRLNRWYERKMQEWGL